MDSSTIVFAKMPKNTNSMIFFIYCMQRHCVIKDVIFPGLFEFSGIGKSREIVTISREFSGTGFLQNTPKYQPKFNIFKIILSTFNVMDIID